MRKAWLILFTGCVSVGAPGYFRFPGAKVASAALVPAPVTVTAPPLVSAEPPCDGPASVTTSSSASAVAAACASPSGDCASSGKPAATATATASASATASVSASTANNLQVEAISAASARASVEAGPTCANPSSSSLPVCTEFFGVPLDGSSDIVFLLDRSASMSETASFGDQGQQPGGSRVNGVAIGVPAYQAGPLLPDKLTVAKGELNKVLAHLPDGTRFAIAFFDDRLDWFTPELSTLNAQTRADASRFIDTIYPRGATAAVPALEAAFTLRPRRVVLLTDGLANFDGSDAELLALARAQIKAGVRFDTVSIGSVEGAQTPSTLASLARESGGLNRSY